MTSTPNGLWCTQGGYKGLAWPCYYAHDARLALNGTSARPAAANAQQSCPLLGPCGRTASSNPSASCTAHHAWRPTYRFRRHAPSGEPWFVRVNKFSWSSETGWTTKKRLSQHLYKREPSFFQGPSFRHRRPHGSISRWGKSPFLGGFPKREVPRTKDKPSFPPPSVPPFPTPAAAQEPRVEAAARSRQRSPRRLRHCWQRRRELEPRAPEIWGWEMCVPLDSLSSIKQMSLSRKALFGC